MSVKTKTITVLPGDHVGTEIVAEAIKSLKAIESNTPYQKFNLNLKII